MKIFKTSGTCAKEIKFSIDGGVIDNVEFSGGCNGNLKGMSILLKGMSIKDVVSKLEGTTCGPRNTSCPDQLAKALREYL